MWLAEGEHMYYHAIAMLPGARRKSIVNKTEDRMLSDVVMPFVSDGIIQLKWGSKNQSYQVIDLRVYRTLNPWDKKTGIPLEEFIDKCVNLATRLRKKAEKRLGKKTYRVFVVMPIQGEKYGTQDQQRIHQEYDRRFEVLEEALGKQDCVAIRIDKEHPIDDLVRRIKEEIHRAKFLVADLTDERPSCYYEVGYAEALGRPVIHVASKESVLHPGQQTKIHFDIHKSVSFFTNHEELAQKVSAAVEKNSDLLFREQTPTAPIISP
jgi:hypothetical protein